MGSLVLASLLLPGVHFDWINKYTEWSSPAVANGVVYISPADANFYALNASNGAKL